MFRSPACIPNSSAHEYAQGFAWIGVMFGVLFTQLRYQPCHGFLWWSDPPRRLGLRLAYGFIVVLGGLAAGSSGDVGRSAYVLTRDISEVSLGWRVEVGSIERLSKYASLILVSIAHFLHACDHMWIAREVGIYERSTPRPIQVPSSLRQSLGNRKAHVYQVPKQHLYKM